MKTKKILALVLVVAMAVMLSVSAFAAWTEGDDAAPDNATLTKRVETPNETILKTGTFTFSFAQVTTDADYSVSSDTADIGTRQIEITNEDKVDSKGDKDIYLDMVNLFDEPKSVEGNSNQKPFPHAGVYKYTVTETVGYANPTEGSGETVHNSEAEYTVYVIVANTKDNTDLYVKEIVVVKNREDDGTSAIEEGETEAPKVDEDDNGGDTITTPGEEGEDDTVTPVGSQFAFTNTYVKTNSTTPDGKEDKNDDDPEDTQDDAALYVQKIVNDVDAPGQIDLTKKFNFEVTVDLPSLADSDVKAVIVTVGEEVPAGANEITFKDNVKQDIKLKHNERLVFKSLPVGTKYKVVETGVDTEQYTVTAVSTDTVNTGNTGVDAGTIAGSDTKNNVVVTNKLIKGSNTPTGILMNNLPYIILMLVVLGGLTGYVVSKRRREQE